jgi:hypothetical protein
VKQQHLQLAVVRSREICHQYPVRATKAVTRIRRKYRVVAPELDERRRRQWPAAEARKVGWGGVSIVARATGLSRPTILDKWNKIEHRLFSFITQNWRGQPLISRQAIVNLVARSPHADLRSGRRRKTATPGRQ